MKHQSALKPQKAYITRRADYDNSLWTQEEAERLALIDGNPEEAKRRRDAATDLRSKKRQAKIAPIPFGIIRELGERDAIGNMLRTRFLEERHGRTALQLRDYMVCREVHMGGSGDLIFIEGKRAGDLADKIHGLRQGQRAVAAGEATLPAENFIRPITGLVCGHVTLLQAGRQIGGDTTKCKARVKGALKQYLEAAEPFFGGS
jgi:hypothetical protein